MTRVLVLLLVLPLAGCITLFGSMTPAQCPQLYKWKPEYRERLAKERETAPAGSAMAEAVDEYIELRGQLLERCP